MAFIRMFENPNVDQERYEAVFKLLGVSSDSLPDGGLVHVAGPGPNGAWRVVEVWESEEAARRFDEERVAPALEQAGVQRPAPETWPVYNLLVRTS